MATTTTNLGLTLPAVSDAADIGVLNTNFQKLDEKCNPALFAPSGYGLGGKTFEPETKDLNETTACGWYAFTRDALNRPFDYGSVMVSNRYGSQVTQMAFNPRMGGHGEICVRHFYDGSWNEWEYINPPMQLGVEYRTTERWDGKVVYTCLVNCGNPVDGSTKSVNHNLTMTQCISCEACAISAAGDSFPVIYGSDSTGSLIHANVYANNGCVHVYTSGGYNESAIIYAKLRYVKV